MCNLSGKTGNAIGFESVSASTLSFQFRLPVLSSPAITWPCHSAYWYRVVRSHDLLQRRRMERRKSEDQTMPSIAPWQHWKCMLDNSRYPANLSDFEDQWRYEGWFTKNIEKDARTETIEFENSFREKAPHHLEAWFEVVFWKLYSNKHASEQAKVIIDTLKLRGISAQDLWTVCCRFIDDPSEQRFSLFQRLLVSDRHIAVCATFPAFIAPDRFPMLDTHIAKWVWKNHEEHNMFAQDDGRLLLPTDFDPVKNKPLTISDFPFYEGWIRW